MKIGAYYFPTDYGIDIAEPCDLPSALRVALRGAPIAPPLRVSAIAH